MTNQSQRLEQIQALGEALDARQQALEATVRRFQGFLDLSPVIAWLKDADGRFVWANNPLCARFAIPLEALVGRDDSDFWPASIAAAVRRNDRHVLTTGETLQLTEIVPTPEGSEVPWCVWKFPVEMDGERYVGGLAIDPSAGTGGPDG